MITHRKITVLVIILTILFGFTFNKVANLKYQGSATDLKSNQLYYTEEHEELIIEGVHSVTKINYKNKNGELIASKTLDYTKGFTTPSFSQQDYRNGHLESVLVNSKGVQITYKASREEKLKTKNIEIKGGFVVDGGFNYFVKNNWSSIVAGNTVKFNFIVPSQLDYYTFRIKKEKEYNLNNKPVVVFLMESDNVFIRALINPIVLTYDKQTHRLVQYEGISNISNTTGGNYVVKITYPTVGP